MYSKTVYERLQHLETAFKILQQHSLLAKRSKCYFAQARTEYLGHFIYAKGVSTNPKKIKVMQEWPQP